MSESIQITGTVKLVEETKTYGSKGFKKRLMVIETESKYQNLIAVEAVKDKCEMFDEFTPGEQVTAHVNIRGSQWKDRYFVSLECWKIQLDGGRSEAPEGQKDAQEEDFDSDPIPF